MEIHFAISVFSVTCMKRLKLELKAKCCNCIKFAGGANSVMSFLTQLRGSILFSLLRYDDVSHSCH